MPWLESLYDMLAETKHAEIIGWDNSGTEIVFHAEKLPSVLENFFRSKELESFEKQLRNYEFKLHQKGTADRPTKYKHPLCTRDGRAFAIEHVTSKNARKTAEKKPGSSDPSSAADGKEGGVPPPIPLPLPALAGTGKGDKGGATPGGTRTPKVEGKGEGSKGEKGASGKQGKSASGGIGVGGEGRQERPKASVSLAASSSMLAQYSHAQPAHSNAGSDVAEGATHVGLHPASSYALGLPSLSGSLFPMARTHSLQQGTVETTALGKRRYEAAMGGSEGNQHEGEDSSGQGAYQTRHLHHSGAVGAGGAGPQAHGQAQGQPMSMPTGMYGPSSGLHGGHGNMMVMSASEAHGYQQHQQNVMQQQHQQQLQVQQQQQPQLQYMQQQGGGVQLMSNPHGSHAMSGLSSIPTYGEPSMQHQHQHQHQGQHHQVHPHGGMGSVTMSPYPSNGLPVHPPQHSHAQHQQMQHGGYQAMQPMSMQQQQGGQQGYHASAASASTMYYAAPMPAYGSAQGQGQGGEPAIGQIMLLPVWMPYTAQYQHMQHLPSLPYNSLSSSSSAGHAGHSSMMAGNSFMSVPTAS